MKRSIWFVCLAFVLVACGSSSTPVVDQSQAVASPVADNPTVIPTNTPLPSPTSLPTATETPIPTVVEASPTATGDPCDGPLLANPVGAADAGKMNNGASIFIKNNTKAPVTVSLYLSKNDFGQCGFVSYVLSPNQSVSVVNELPYGCYYASAYVNDPKKPSRATGGPACITGPDKTTFTVSADKIKVTGP